MLNLEDQKERRQPRLGTVRLPQMDNVKLVNARPVSQDLYLQMQFQQILYKLYVRSLMMRVCSMKEKSMYDNEVRLRKQEIACFLKCN